MSATVTRDELSAVPTVVLRHLAGDASLGELIGATKPNGARGAVLEREEIGGLLRTLRANSLELAAVADLLGELLNTVPKPLADLGCPLLPVLSRGKVCLAVLRHWQWDIHLAALMTPDPAGGVFEKRAGSPEFDRLQARLSEYPINARDRRRAHA